MSPSSSVACPICATSDLSAAWAVGRYTLSRCRACGHLFVSAGFDAASLEHAYDQTYYDSGGGDTSSGYKDYLANADRRMRGFAHRLREIERRAQQRGSLLDFGCAVGLFVKVAKDAGWQALGYERSEWAAAYGREQFGLDITVGTGDAPADFKDRFDVVTMWDVLEHLEDPRQVVQRVASWVKPGGIVALNTVDSGSFGARRAGVHWRHIAPPHHLHYFTRRSLLELLRRCGLRAVTRRSQGVMWGADPRRLPLRGALHATEELVTHWRAKSIVDALNLLDEVEILAVRDL